MPASPRSKSPRQTKKSAKKTAKSQKNPKKSAGGATSSASAAASVAATKKSAARAKADEVLPITNYASAIKWLDHHVDHERLRLVRYNEETFGLDRMGRLLDHLGNPQQQIKAVHVAGTKGKGSTCTMCASMLHACGYTIGLYTSPHLNDLRERISIDGRMIPYSELTEIMRQIAEAESSEPKLLEDPPSYFELLTAAAFMYFAEQAVDVAILETGLGGRLDSTNVCDPLVTAITHISLDHMNLLGDNVHDIAKEKAGIFKKEVPAISVEQSKEAAAGLREVAEQAGTPLQFNGQQLDFSYRFEANKELGPHTRVSLSTSSSNFEHLAVPLHGEHQAHNCGLALAILDKLKAHGFHIAEDKVVQGLERTHLPGRMEQVWSRPRVIIDGAHNAQSINALIRALGAHISYDSLVVIFGCGLDKDVRGMLKELALGADKVIFTKARSNQRALEPDDLLSRFADHSTKMAQAEQSLEPALKLAGRAVSREDLVLITGSFHLIGEARKYFQDRAQNAPAR